MSVSTGKGYTEIRKILPDDIQIACHNSSKSCTLSGPADTVKIFVQKLKEEGIFAKTVNVANIAFHSKYIAPLGPRYLDILRQVR